MRLISKRSYRMKQRPSLEALDDRQLLSGGMAGPLAYKGLLPPRAIAWMRSGASAIQGRIFTPESGLAAQRRALLANNSMIQGARQVVNPSTFRPRPLNRPALMGARPSAMRQAAFPVAKTPSVTVVSTANLTPTSTDQASQVVQQIIDLTNQARIANNLPSLTPNSRLMEAAAIQSSNMAAANEMSHDLESSSLPTLVDRAKYVQYSYRSIGENIALNQPDAASLVAAWMNSPPHRQNILNPQFTEVGAGLAYSRRGEPYYTLVMAKPA